ncbi:AMP-binding protein [Streptomyces endophyticus]|uniref:Long-chain-fatty-acid--CoA ligase n=1 Tax=Streptomyces endophyticus TaxID=714166 RepID=A0ABU6F0N3_9ACTN|nr:AMP-binding protein [Streptomyces endophyticus]MEB8337187.1 AMP-binding protein [Streptomyces endophyticus]
MTTLTDLLSGLVDRDPDAVLAIDAGPGPDPRSTEGTAVTRREFQQRAARLRTDLADAGVGRDDSVAVWLPNWSSALVWQFAAAGLGAHVVGVNTRYNVDELVHVLDRAHPKVLALAHDFHGLDLAGILRRALPRTTAPTPVVAVVPGPGCAPPADPSAYDMGAGAMTPRTAGDTTAVPVHTTAVPVHTGDELTVAFTTSGSTGRPKLAAHRESAVVAHAEADARALGIGDGDVVGCILPLSGTFGFTTAMAAIAGGAACLLEPVFQEDTALAGLARHGATHLVGGDDMVSRLMDAWRREPRDLSRLRWLGMADFLGRTRDIAAWARKEFGTHTSGVYGSSEVFALALCWPPGEPAPRRWTGGGRPVSPDIAVRVVDPETDEPVRPGAQGELQLRGPNTVDAYLGDPEAAERAFTADGWFRTGDLATLAEDGAVEYVCRMGDVLRLRGFLVDPAEIEQRLAAHPAVRTAKVVGARGPDGAPQAVAFVVLDTPTAPEGLREWCAQGLARFKVPAAVHALDSMPTTSGTNGTKIRAAALRERAQQLLTGGEQR